MKQMKQITAAAVIALFALGSSLSAEQDKHHNPHSEGDASTAAAHKPNGEHHGGHPNHIALFLGATTTLNPSATFFTAGADYERRLPFANNMLGIGLLVDFAFDFANKMQTGIFAVPVTIHPAGGLKIFVAPGLEAVFGAPAGAHGGGGTHTAFVLRGGIGYDIHVGGFAITPTFSADWLPEANHVSLVYGLAFGKGF